MGVMYAPDIIQTSFSNLMKSLEFARIYLDNLLCFSRGCIEEHLTDVEKS